MRAAHYSVCFPVVAAVLVVGACSGTNGTESTTDGSPSTDGGHKDGANSDGGEQDGASRDAQDGGDYSDGGEQDGASRDAQDGGDAHDGLDSGYSSDAVDSGYAIAACIHQDSCDAIGTTCNNACGFPCVCTDFFYALGWNCFRPLNGTRCDPVTSGACSYPGYGHDETIYCTCFTLDGGDPYWMCGGTSMTENGSICPLDKPISGQSCDLFPAGFSCGYPSDSGFLDQCSCVRGDAGKVWQCPA